MRISSVNIIKNTDKMKIKLLIILAILFSINLNAQKRDYSIEYETHKVGVFNPEWECFQSLNPQKYEHLTGYFREELAKIILDKVRKKEIKIYDNRKRELSLDSVINRIIIFEKQQGKTLNKNNALTYIIPYISAYDFEEAVTYNYKDLTIEKQIIAYQPYIVHYKSFGENCDDSIQMPLFWIFPKDTIKQENKNTTTPPIFSIADTILSILELKYPVKMPLTLSIFDNVQGKKIPLLHSDGSNFVSPKEIDDLFVLKSIASIYDEQTGKDSVINTYSDILPEDISAIRIAENWSIDPSTLMIKKQVQYFLPLYLYDEKTFKQLGVRITCKKN